LVKPSAIPQFPKCAVTIIQTNRTRLDYTKQTHLVSSSHSFTLIHTNITLLLTFGDNFCAPY